MLLPVLLCVIACLGTAAYAANFESITFQDKNLYARVCEEHDSVIASKDDGTKTITIASSDLAGITSLNLRSANISDLSGIERFTALTDLDLCQNLVSDVTKLSTLTDLQTLNLYDNGIGDLAGLENLTNLTYLSLGYNNENNNRNNKQGIRNLSALESLVNLRYLDFSWNWTNTLADHIGGLTKLETLDLSRNNGVDLTKLTGLANLKSINLFFNGVKDITPLYGLQNLEEVILQKNSVRNISGMFADGSLIWPKLKKLDLSHPNYDFYDASLPALESLKGLARANRLEFNYEYVTDTTGLPHIDATGKPYVTYDDFGARADGEYDDFIAMRNAHLFANEYTAENGTECEVRATAGKTYHIFQFYEDAATANTSTDWMGANFVVHDENIDEKISRYKGILKFENTPDIETLDAPDFTIGKATKSLAGLSQQLDSKIAALNAKGYKQYNCAAFNSDKQQFIRTGKTKGEAQQDYFNIDSAGNVQNDIQWDFDHLTSFTITPISNTKLEVKNGNFTTNALLSERELTETTQNSSWSYYYRELLFENATNVSISNITHSVSKDCVSGSYVGFINLKKCANATISDCSLFTRKYLTRSTYDLELRVCTNVTLKNVVSNDIDDENRYGITGCGYLKDVVYENCRLNRAETHQGVYNLTVKNCEIGWRGIQVVGAGQLNIIGSTINAWSLVNLRPDYGSFWDGDVRIINCTYNKKSSKIPMALDASFTYADSSHTVLRDFGYDCRFPNVYIDNLDVDYGTHRWNDDMSVVPNDKNRMPDLGFPDYWPTNIYVNRCNFVSVPNPKIKLRSTFNPIDKAANTEYNYAITDLTLNLADGTDVTQAVFADSSYTTAQNVTLSLKKNKSANNAFSIFKDGAALEEDVSLTEDVERTFEEGGTYRIEVASTDVSNAENAGHVTYEFAIEATGTNPPVDPNETVAITFPDGNLYSAITTALPGSISSKDDGAKTVTLTQGNLAAITELKLPGALIADLSGMEAFTSLESLDLHQNKIADITSLCGLKSLTNLNLYDNVIGDIGGIGNLTNLTSLNIGFNNEGDKRNGIRHLDELELLVNLRDLDFSYNINPEVTEHLGRMPSLESVDLSRCVGGGKMDFTPLSNLKNLKRINLYWDAFRDITVLTCLPKLEEVRLQNNSLRNISAMMVDGKLVWPNLKRIDIFDNLPDTLATTSGDVLALLKRMSAEGVLEFDFEESVPTPALPHVDADGTVYITYDDFGAYCNGTFDDFIAIRNAHRFANSYTDSNGVMCEVRATPGKTYHIFKYYAPDVKVKTSTDWKNASFIIHDEEIDLHAGRASQIFLFDNSADRRTIENPSFIINSKTRKLTGIEGTLAELNAKGYTNYYCAAINEDKRIYKRSANGCAQQDWFMIDREGNVQNDIMWDYDKLTSLEIIPATDRKIQLRNATFVTNVLDSRTEYSARTGIGKEVYFYRGMSLKNLVNVSVANVRHVSDSDEQCGSYAGFFYFDKCANIEMRDCQLMTRKSISSTYDLRIEHCTNVLVKDVTQNETDGDTPRWGVTGTNHVKDITYDGCTINVIDSHEGNYNLTVKNCLLKDGNLCLAGKGTMDISNTTIMAGTFLNIRSDYGSTWDGDVRITDCTLKYQGTGEAQFTNFAFVYTDSAHTVFKDFGYNLRFPNIYIDNLTVDLADYTRYNYMYVLTNTRGSIGYPYPGFPEYWSKYIYINRCNVVNAPAGNFKTGFSAQKVDKVAGGTYNYAVTGVDLRLDDGTDVTRECYSEAGARTGNGITLTAKENLFTTNTLTVYKDGTAIERDVPVEGTLTRHYSEPGAYRVEANSVDRQQSNDNTGVGVYAFTIDSEPAHEEPSHEHTMSHVPAKEPTCSQDGRIEHYTCMVCGKFFADAAGNVELDGAAALAIPANTANHVWGEWKVVTSPTETSAGKKMRTCTSDPMHVDIAEIPALGHKHSLVKHEAVAATCTAPGSIEHYTCAGCAALFADAKAQRELPGKEAVAAPVDPTAHSWGEWVTVSAPTATAAGLQQRLCLHNAAHSESRELPATGNSDESANGSGSASGNAGDGGNAGNGGSESPSGSGDAGSGGSASPSESPSGSADGNRYDGTAGNGGSASSAPGGSAADSASDAPGESPTGNDAADGAVSIEPAGQNVQAAAEAAESDSPQLASTGDATPVAMLIISAALAVFTALYSARRMRDLSE